MLPAQQRLVAAEPVGAQIVDRLVVDLELIPLECDAQIGFAGQPLVQPGLHVGLEDAVRPTPYAGGGYAVLYGFNVESNSEYELGAGGSFPIWKGDSNNEVRLGLDLVYFAYDKNLRLLAYGCSYRELH
jgi:hypothetical protein